jgi:hypothetical protein
MQDNIVGIVIGVLFAGVWLLALTRILIKALKTKYAPIRSVKAVVTDKHIIETFSKYAGNGKREKYVIVFSVNGKKKSFYVSQFSYGGYRIHEEGTLQFKGDKLIGFQ